MYNILNLLPVEFSHDIIIISIKWVLAVKKNHYRITLKEEHT
jgi:hypothetical protein